MRKIVDCFYSLSFFVHSKATWFKLVALCLTWSEGGWNDSIFQL